MHQAQCTRQRATERQRASRAATCGQNTMNCTCSFVVASRCGLRQKVDQGMPSVEALHVLQQTHVHHLRRFLLCFASNYALASPLPACCSSRPLSLLAMHLVGLLNSGENGVLSPIDRCSRWLREVAQQQGCRMGQRHTGMERLHLTGLLSGDL